MSKSAKAKPAPEKASEPKAHRRETYSRELSDKILALLADGKTLRGLCRELGNVVSPGSVKNWVVDDIDGFAERYERARDRCLETWADEIIDIGDEPAIDQAAVQRNRTRIDARKWTLSKLKPERYGDKVSVDLNSQAQRATDEQLEAKLGFLVAPLIAEAVANKRPLELPPLDGNGAALKVLSKRN